MRLKTVTGTTYFTDCLAIMEACAAPQGTQLPVVVQAVLLHHHNFWPLTVSSQGKVIVNVESSTEAYELFVEREGCLYRLPLLLGIALVIFAFWFGSRSTLP